MPHGFLFVVFNSNSNYIFFITPSIYHSTFLILLLQLIPPMFSPHHDTNTKQDQVSYAQMLHAYHLDIEQQL